MIRTAKVAMLSSPKTAHELGQKMNNMNKKSCNRVLMLYEAYSSRTL